MLQYFRYKYDIVNQSSVQNLLAVLSIVLQVADKFPGGRLLNMKRNVRGPSSSLTWNFVLLSMVPPGSPSTVTVTEKGFTFMVDYHKICTSLA